MNMNSGYAGYSMSNRAMSAYANGEMPLSKWTKQAIIDSVITVAADEDITISEKLLNQLTKKELVNAFLYNSSWHHTSSYINRTEFYAIDTDAISNNTTDTINRIIAARVPKSSKPAKATKSAPETVKALCRYTYWTGTRKHPKANTVEEVLTWTDGNKLIQTSNGNKRLSSITILNRLNA